MSMEAWLDSLYIPEGRIEPWLYKDKHNTTVLERVSFLIYAKGPKRGVSWGSYAFGEGPYGRTGLSQDEAIELVYLFGVRDGLLFVEGAGALELFKRRVKEETLRVAQEVGYVGDEDDYEDGSGTY